MGGIKAGRYLPGTVERRIGRGLHRVDRRQAGSTTVGERLRAIRERAGLSHARFASTLGYAARTIYNWEDGSAEPPMEILPKLRKQYDVDPEWVVSGKDLNPVSRYQETDND